jgi:hypothetical protein
MRHQPPPGPTYQDAKPRDPIQEIALRVVVVAPGGRKMAIMGTATLIAGNLAITARHILDRVPNNFGKGCSYRLYQVLPGPVYRVFHVMQRWNSSSDITLLQLALDETTEPINTAIVWRCPAIRVLPPPEGQRVWGFGFREGAIEIIDGAGGVDHRELNDIGTTVSGEIVKIYDEKRDTSMMPFPCFHVTARFEPGMSGGLVLDENGSLCGLISAGTDFLDPDAVPIGWATTLWPILTTLISADRGNSYARGIEYPVIDLALAGIVHAFGLDKLNPIHFPGRVLPSSGR